MCIKTLTHTHTHAHIPVLLWAEIPRQQGSSLSEEQAENAAASSEGPAAPAVARGDVRQLRDAATLIVTVDGVNPGERATHPSRGLLSRDTVKSG